MYGLFHETFPKSTTTFFPCRQDGGLLIELNLFSLSKRWLKGDLIMLFK